MGSNKYSFDPSSNASWVGMIAASRTDPSHTPRRKGIASRQKSPGPSCFPVGRGRRNVRFPERSQADIPGIPYVRLDPLLEQYGQRVRLHSRFCPQGKLSLKTKSVSRVSLSLGALQGCPLCVLGCFAANALWPKLLGNKRRVLPRPGCIGEGDLQNLFPIVFFGDNLQMYTTSGTLPQSL
jgi:hypothetical protein